MLTFEPIWCIIIPVAKRYDKRKRSDKGNGSIAQLGEHLPYKQRVTGSSPVVPTTFGPVVQLVRTPACHAGGRRFEPVPGRQYMLIWLRWQSTSLVRTRSPVRIRLSAPKSAQRKCVERLFLSKTKKVCATAHTFFFVPT